MLKKFLMIIGLLLIGALLLWTLYNFFAYIGFIGPGHEYNECMSKAAENFNKEHNRLCIKEVGHEVNPTNPEVLCVLPPDASDDLQYDFDAEVDECKKLRK